MTETFKSDQPEPNVSPQDVERVLAVGQLLLSVLTHEELEVLRQALKDQRTSQNDEIIIGNASGS